MEFYDQGTRNGETPELHAIGAKVRELICHTWGSGCQLFDSRYLKFVFVNFKGFSQVSGDSIGRAKCNRENVNTLTKTSTVTRCFFKH